MVRSFMKKHLLGKHVYIPNKSALEFFKYLGPGLLVTVGFIDPGNWASNLSAGSMYGEVLLWTVTLGTIMLIVLQHNAAHLGIVTGYCLAEATAIYTKPWTKNLVLFSAMLASISTAMAEILGGGIALNILFKIPTKLGAFLVMLFVLFMLYTNSYKKLEKTIVAFVSIIGFSFILELTFIHIEWHQAIIGLIKPTFPKNSMPVIMSVLGAVVMPHNLFLHSEIIQSRQWNLEDEKIIEKQLKYEFLDTFFSMFVGLVINSAMIIVASSTFYEKHVQVTELNQAYEMLKPMLGNSASIIFAVALLFAGLSAAMTAGMSGGSIFSGIFKEPYDSKDIHTKLGIGITIVTSMLVVLMISNYFDGLVYSQMFLSIQLPITVFTQIYLTSSKKVMGKYANSLTGKAALWVIGIVVAVLNVALLLSYTMFGHI